MHGSTRKRARSSPSSVTGSMIFPPAAADIGIAMDSGTDAAIEVPDVVLVGSDFPRMAHALGLTKATR